MVCTPHQIFLTCGLSILTKFKRIRVRSQTLNTNTVIKLKDNHNDNQRPEVMIRAGVKTPFVSNRGLWTVNNVDCNVRI